MRSLDMDGPFPLTRAEIERVVVEPLPGNFALGRMTKDKRFQVRFVGRDDTSVRDALLNNLNGGGGGGLLKRMLGGGGEASDCFKFSYSQDGVAAYQKHCRTYHGFNKQGSLENRTHPKPPPGAKGLKCPICGES